MSANGKRPIVVSRSDTGKLLVPTGNLQTMIFHIHNFAGCTEKRGESIFTEMNQAHGYSWKLRIYPRGHSSSSPDQEHVSVFLKLCDVDRDVEAVATMHYGQYPREVFFERRNYSNKTYPGVSFPRSKILDRKHHYLDENGTLTIAVDIDVFVEKTRTWKRRKIVGKDAMACELYQSRDANCDVQLLVDGTLFPSQRCILSLRAPVILELLSEASSTASVANPAKIQLSGVSAKTFDVIHKYIYSVLDPEDQDNISIWEDFDTTTAIMTGSDRYGITDLKLYAESMLVENHLVVANAVDLLLLADAHTCALLKEAAIKLCAKNALQVSTLPSWATVMESPKLMADLRKSAEDSSPDVTTLRERLDAAGLDVDGSRETLVARLAAQETSGSEDEDSVVVISD